MKKLVLLMGLTIFALALALTLASAQAGANHYGPVPATPSGGITAPPAPPPAGAPPPGPTPVIDGVRAVEPPVSEASIRAYMSTATARGMSASHVPMTTTSIEFLTVAQLRQKLSSPLYLSYYPATAGVAYVQFTGQMVVDTGGSGKNATYSTSHGYMLFDARTGNLVAGGAK